MDPAVPCPNCGAEITSGYGCPACTQRFGEVFLKAMADDFHYAAGLRSGVTVEFGHLKYAGGDWVFLARDEHQVDTPVGGLMCPRGVWVRLSDIVWMADAPSGS